MDEPQKIPAPVMNTTPITPSPAPTPVPAPFAPQVAPAPVAVEPPEGSNTGMIVGIIVAVIIIAAAVYYFFGRTSGEVAMVSPSPSESVLPSETPTPSPAATIDPTADWKTYTNSNIGFAMKYPVEMDPLQVTDKAYPGNSKLRDVYIAGKTPALELIVRANNPGTGGNDVASPSLGSIIVDGVTINYKSGKIDAMGATAPGKEMLWIGGFSVASDGYDFQFTSPDGSDQTSLVRQILSTFMFTK